MADEPADEPPAEEPKYDQAFFLALAAKGKDAWNAWRRDPANKDVYVTFEGADFSQAPRDTINFDGFEFGHAANFSNCKWRGPEYHDIKYGSKAFHAGRAFFPDAAFGDETNFTGADFGDAAIFTFATFEHVVSFHGAIFGINPDFSCVTFGDYALFEDAVFGAYADFTGTAFGYLSNFERARFGGHVEFSGLSLEQWNGKSHMRLSFNKRHVELWERFDSGPDLFLGISFKDACFDGEAIFSGRVFEEIVDFTNACFYFPPTFSSITNSVWVDLTGVHFDFVPTETLRALTTSSEIPLRLRAFRKVAEETKNHDLERDLYIAEREAERGVHWRHLAEKLKRAPVTDKPRILGRILSHALWIGVMFGYLAFADYGRSFARPLAWLVASGFFFYWRYLAVLADKMAKAPDVEKYMQAVRMLAVGNTVPFVGPLTIDSDIKKFLFCPSSNCPGPLIPPEGYQLLVLGQNLLSIILVFFIGLALRNYFKIK
jgi:uncharacterized protein YjbI with pentapeptide repeats